MASSTIVRTIDKVVEQSRGLYSEYIQSDYIAVDVRVDGVLTRGQCKDRSNSYTIKEENTKMMTCELSVPVHRGSYIEMRNGKNDDGFSLTGIVISVPNETPVDFYFSTLFFNTVVNRERKQELYDDDGNIIGDSPIVVDDIDCFVQRVGMRERQVDAGIDRNSVNQLITVKKWDLKIDDLLYVGSDRYIITDIEELDKDILSVYMTYYRG